MVPVGASKCVGASRSSRARNSHGNSAISASERLPGESSFNEILSYSDGTSQFSLSAASAASDRSGQLSPSALRRKVTRSRHCFRDFDHGSLSSPAATNPAAKMRAVSAEGDSATGASDSVIACSVRLRRARSAIAPRSNEISSVFSI